MRRKFQKHKPRRYARRFSKRDAARELACPHCHRPYAKYLIPDDAFRLIEDIPIIERMIKDVEGLDPRTFSDDNNEAATTGRRLLHILWAMRNKARDRFCEIYGAPFKSRKRPQTMAQVWEILREDLEQHDERSEVRTPENRV